jgi:hypothetical protein
MFDVIRVDDLRKRLFEGVSCGQRKAIPPARNGARSTLRLEVQGHRPARLARHCRYETANLQRKESHPVLRPATHPYLSKTHRDPSGSIESDSGQTPMLTDDADTPDEK